MNTKTCPCCKRELPASTEYFHRCRSRSDGLLWRCKQCQSELRKPVRNTPEAREKRNEYQRAWQKKNPDKHAAAIKRWAKAHPEVERAIDKRSREKNKEKIKLYLREYYLANKTTIRDINERWRLSHLEQWREAQREWAKQHPERIYIMRRRYALAHPDASRAACANRRSRIRNATGTHTKEDISKQYRAQKGKCYYCGREVGKNYHVDHIIPLSRGGTNDPSNLVIACPECNVRKGGRMPHEWAQGGHLL